MENSGALPWAGKSKPLIFSDELEPEDYDYDYDYDDYQIPPHEHMDNWEDYA